MNKKVKEKVIKINPAYFLLPLLVIFFILIFLSLAQAENGIENNEEKISISQSEMQLAYWVPPPPPGEDDDNGDDNQDDEEYYEDNDEQYEEPEWEDDEQYDDQEEYDENEEENIMPMPPRPPKPPTPPWARTQPQPKPKLPERKYFRKDPNTAMMYSFFLPGFGQFYAEEPGKGIMFLITEGIFIGLAAYNWGMADYYDRKGDLYYYFYDEMTGDYIDDKTAYHYRDQYYNRYKNWLYVEIAVHLLDIIDARNSAIEYNQRHNLSYSIIHDKNKVGLKLGVTF